MSCWLSAQKVTAHDASGLDSSNLPADQVYVTGLPKDVTEAEVEAHFGSIGVIKLDKKRDKKKIWLYRDKATGELKVCCMY